MPFLIKLLLIPSVTWELSFHIRILYNFFNNTILISMSILISTLFPYFNEYTLVIKTGAGSKSIESAPVF